jgi:hypothetical protein
MIEAPKAKTITWDEPVISGIFGWYAVFSRFPSHQTPLVTKIDENY